MWFSSMRHHTLHDRNLTNAATAADLLIPMHSQRTNAAPDPREGLALLEEVVKVCLDYSIEAPKVKCSHVLADGIAVQPLTHFLLRAIQVRI